MAGFFPVDGALAVTVRLDIGSLVNAGGGTLADLNDMIIDSFNGGDGNDHFVAGASSDLFLSSLGADTMRGGGGNDTIVYQLNGHVAGDVIDGGAGIDDLRLNDGEQFYDFTTATFAGTGGAAIDRLQFEDLSSQQVVFNGSQFGGSGIASSLVILGASPNAAKIITINNASSFTAAGFTIDMWDAALDRFTVNGTTGADSITGSIRNDRIIGGIGADTLAGWDADDTLDGGAGNDSLVGGDGNDMATYLSSGAGVTLNLLQGLRSGDAVGDVYDSIERFQMSNLADLFLASNDAVWVDGADGADILYGGRGSDTLNGGVGNDFLLPDFPGTPTAYAADTIDGGAGFDAVYYFGEAVSLNLATGVHSGQAAGDSFTSIEAFLMSEGADTLIGRDDAGGSDIFYGLGGADSMNGLGGFDYLLGGDGADTLTGGFGWDLLTGGAGADRFVYETGGQGGTGEVITDFQVGIDKIAFVTASTGITGLTLGQNLFIQNSNVTTITGSQGTTTGPTLIYDTSNGTLWYDTNGNAALGLIVLAGFTGAPVLTAADFMVV